MLRRVAGKLSAVAAITMVLCLPTRAQATCKCGASGCLTKDPGDSCGSGLVCEAIKDPSTGEPKICKGKTLGDILCACTNSNSKLVVPETEDFSALDLPTNPSEKTKVTIKDGGGVPLNVTISLTSGMSAFSGRMVTKTIEPFGTYEWPLRFDPEKGGDYSGTAHITSDAALGSPDKDISLSGSAFGRLGFEYNLPRIPIAKLGGNAEAAANKLNIGLIYEFDTSETTSELKYSNSTDDGTTWSTASKLYGPAGRMIISPLMTCALSGNGFQVMYTDDTATPVGVWTFGFTPGTSPTITPTMVANGIAESFAVGGGQYWAGIEQLGSPPVATFWGSTNGTKWTQYNVPVNASDITSDSNIVYGWHQVWAVWTDSGTSIGSPITRYASLSTDNGTTWGTPVTVHDFPSGAAVAYSPPNTFFNDGTLLDFFTWLPASATLLSSGVDYLTPGATAFVDQPIGSSGLQSVFGHLYNHSFLAGIGIDTANHNTLNTWHWDLGIGTPKVNATSITDVVESRDFGLGLKLRYDGFATVVRPEEPGKVSLLFHNVF